MEHFNDLDIHKSVGIDRMHQGVLSELDNATPPVIFKRSQQLERVLLSTERKKANIIPI